MSSFSVSSSTGVSGDSGRDVGHAPTTAGSGWFSSASSDGGEGDGVDNSMGELEREFGVEVITSTIGDRALISSSEGEGDTRKSTRAGRVSLAEVGEPSLFLHMLCMKDLNAGILTCSGYLRSSEDTEISSISES